MKVTCRFTLFCVCFNCTGGLAVCTKIIYDLKTILFSLLLLCCSLLVSAQTDSSGLRISADTINASSRQDSLPGLSPNDTLPALNFSPDSLSERVDYFARDSIINDLVERKTYLYGQAWVKYEDIKLEAAYIELDWNKQELYAHGLPDTTGRVAGRPHFSDGNQQFQAKELRYNFNSRKGFIIDARSTYEDLYLQTRRAKFISEVDTAGRSLLYGKDAIFTTCDAEHPHYGIRSTRQKILTDKIAIVGPSNLELLDVPTPLWLPFGFFPLTKGRSTGLIFPRDYNYDQRFGFGFQNVGWYFPIGDRLGLQLTTDIYFKGSFRLRAVGDYARRYKYRGNFRLEYSNLVEENALAQTGRVQTMLIGIQHNQDQRAHPSRNIGGSVNIQTGNALRLNYNDAGSQLNNTLRSNFAWRESFPGKPYSMSLSFNHSQNTQTQLVTINFPTFNFQTQTVYPFRRKKAVGARKWYEEIALVYQNEAKATVTTIDTLLFREETLEQTRYAAKHDLSLNTSVKFFKYFNFNPRVNYKEYWYFEQIQKTFDPDTVFLYDYVIDPETKDTLEVVPKDTLYGSILTDTLRKFQPLRTFNISASVNTRLYGTLLFKKGPLRGLRHVLTPSLSLTYSPDYTSDAWDYFDYVQADSRRPDSLLRYNKFATGMYGSAPETGGGFSLNYELRNLFEAKLFSRRDSSTRNVPLIKNFSIRGSYSLGKQSLPFSQVRMSGNTPLLKGFSNVNFSFTFDPYEVNEAGERIEVFVWDKRRKPLRFVKGDINFTVMRVTVAQVQKLFAARQKTDKEKTTNELLAFFSGLSLNYNLKWQFFADTAYIGTHSFDIRGSIPLSEWWQVQVGSFGYDFRQKRLTYPSFTISRDLHCWEMGLSWYPTQDSYTFYLRVDTGTALDFINIPYRKGIQGDFGGFGVR